MCSKNITIPNNELGQTYFRKKSFGISHSENKYIRKIIFGEMSGNRCIGTQILRFQ